MERMIKSIYYVIMIMMHTLFAWGLFSAVLSSLFLLVSPTLPFSSSFFFMNLPLGDVSSIAGSLVC